MINKNFQILNRGLGELNRGLILKGGKNGKKQNVYNLGNPYFINKFSTRGYEYD